MKKLDFLSNSPKTFIFQKSSNKTTFGGFLTIIYILVILIIAFVYICNYAANDKYIISYINYEKDISYDDIIELDKDPKYNPTLNFSFNLYFELDKFPFPIPLSKNFILVDLKTGNQLERKKYYPYNVSSLDIGIFYNCSDKNCSLRPEDEEMYEDHIKFYFNIANQIFNLDFQNKEEPINLSDVSVESNYLLSHDVSQFAFQMWQIIKIKEEKGILDNFFRNKNDSFAGTYFRSECRNAPNKIIDTTKSSKYNFSGVYKVIFEYSSENTYRNYAEYSRKRVSAFSLIANICSLALTIFNGFRFGFNFLYSEKFSNYKVIDNILTSKRKPKKTKKNN